MVGIADFAFATASEYAVATTMAAARSREYDARPGRGRPRAGDVAADAGGSAAARAIARLRPDLHVYSNEDVVAQFNQNGFAYFRQVSVVLSSVTLVFAFLLVATLLTVSTNQRLGEIAALRALGIRRSRIAAMLLWESAVLVGAGGLLALPLGGLLAYQLDRLLRQMPGLPERLHFFVFNPSAVVEHAAAAGRHGDRGGVLSDLAHGAAADRRNAQARGGRVTARGRRSTGREPRVSRCLPVR